VDSFKELETRGFHFLKGLSIKRSESWGDGFFNFSNRGKGYVPQRSKDLSLNTSNGIFNFCFVFGLSYSCRNDRKPIVFTDMLIVCINIGVVAMSLTNT